jgi:arginine decarboxylase-like protein
VSGLGSIGSERIKTDEDRKVANWTIRDSLDLYNVLNWGSGFFAINDAGDVAVHPKTNDERSIDLLELVENLGRRGVFADLTCDSDGKIDQFINTREAKNLIELHPWTGAPYYIGVFLVGAYQEILGDFHNLFGDTNAVHVTLDDEGDYTVDHIVEGDTVEDVLAYVQYERRPLIEKVRQIIEGALRSNDISLEESTRLLERYEQGLMGYTYLSGQA